MAGQLHSAPPPFPVPFPSYGRVAADTRRSRSRSRPARGVSWARSPDPPARRRPRPVSSAPALPASMPLHWGLALLNYGGPSVLLRHRLRLRSSPQTAGTGPVAPPPGRDARPRVNFRPRGGEKDRGTEEHGLNGLIFLSCESTDCKI